MKRTVSFRPLDRKTVFLNWPFSALFVRGHRGCELATKGLSSACPIQDITHMSCLLWVVYFSLCVAPCWSFDADFNQYDRNGSF